jgi:hypothetical protein
MRFDDRFFAATRTVARILGVASCVVFLVWRIEHGIPANGEAGHWETLVQLVLLVLVAVGNFISWRWEIAGATVMAVGGLSLAVVLAFQYDPTSTVPLALLFFTPAALHWLAWQRHRSRGVVIAFGALFLGMLAGTTYLADAVFDYFYGPAHPQSELTALPPSPVEWVWSGAVTPTSAEVKAAVPDSRDVRLVVGTDEALTDPVTTVDGVDAGVDAGTGESSDVFAFTLDDLAPDTAYHYAVEVDGTRDTTRQGTFRTFPDGAGSFTVAVGSCGRYGSNGAVFDTIRSHDPLLYLQVGDLTTIAKPSAMPSTPP